MAATGQKNFQLYTYVDDAGQSWNKRGEVDGARGAVDGHAAFGAHPNWGTETRRHSVRKIIYQDATTFRTKRVIFYTAAAYAAVALGDVIAFTIESEVAAVNYAAIKKVPERQPAAAAARQLAEHA